MLESNDMIHIELIPNSIQQAVVGNPPSDPRDGEQDGEDDARLMHQGGHIFRTLLLCCFLRKFRSTKKVQMLLQSVIMTNSLL